MSRPRPSHHRAKAPRPVVEVLLILAAFGVLALASHLLTPPEPQTPPVAASAAA